MNMLRILIFGVVVLAQLAVPAAMIWQREQTLNHGRVWKFRTAPVDPVDVIRGRYIALRFAAEEFTAPTKFEAGDNSVCAVLKEGADRFAEIDHLTTEAVRTDDAVPVESFCCSGSKKHGRFLSINSGSRKRMRPQPNAPMLRTTAATIRMPT